MIDGNKSYYSIYPATVRHAGHYYCQVENQYGVEISATATVAVSTSQTTNIPSGTSAASSYSLKGLTNIFSNIGSQIQDSILAYLAS